MSQKLGMIPCSSVNVHLMLEALIKGSECIRHLYQFTAQLFCSYSFIHFFRSSCLFYLLLSCTHVDRLAEATSTSSQSGHLEAAGDGHLSRLIKKKCSNTSLWNTKEDWYLKSFTSTCSKYDSVWEQYLLGELYEPPGGKQDNFN